MRSEALTEFLNEHGAQRFPWRNAEVVSGFGELGQQIAAATTHVALADRNERATLTAEGRDVVTLLQGLVTGDMYTLGEPGSGMITTAVDLNGRLIADMRVFHMPDVLVFDLEADAAAAFLGHARRHVIMEDAKFFDRTSTTCRLLLLGPQAATTLGRVGRFVFEPALLEPYRATWGRVGPYEVVMTASPDFGVPAFELFCDVDAGAGLARRLLSFASWIGFEALEDLRVQTGYPRWGVELDTKVIPLEADMNYGVSYTKGCYLGQEIITRLDTRGVPAKMLRHLMFSDGFVPEPGAQVVLDGEKVGEVRSRSQAGRALAYLKRGHNQPGGTVEVDGHRAQVQRVPPW